MLVLYLPTLASGYIQLCVLFSPNVVDRPIHDAIESGCLDLVKVLISHGADPQAEFGEKTPMEYALSIDQMEIYKYLEGLTEDISTYLTHFNAMLQYIIVMAHYHGVW